MTLHVFGSINIDHVYRLPHFPKAGETLSTSAYAVGLGGKDMPHFGLSARVLVLPGVLVVGMHLQRAAVQALGEHAEVVHP